MRQYTDPLEKLFVKGQQIQDEDEVFITYSDKLRKVVVTISDKGDYTLTRSEKGTLINVQLTQQQTGLFNFAEPVSVQVNWIPAETRKRMATTVTNVWCEENLIKEVL